jgi:outer membrane protein W
MKKLLTLILASTAFVAIADENGSGFYIGAGVGAGWNNQVAPATTFRLDGGYSFTQNWAIELGTTGLTQSGAAYNQNMQYYDLSVKGTLPLGQMLDIYAQVGGAYGAPGVTGGSIPGYTDASGNFIPNPTSGFNQSSWNFMSGVGVDVNFTKNWAMNLSDLYYYGPSAGIQGNTNVLLLGVKYQM